MTEQTTASGTTVPAATQNDTGQAPGLLARSIAEGAGSFLVILTGLGATVLATESALQPALVFGLAVTAAMIAFGHVSGGHFNPAITIGSAVAGRTRLVAVLPYVVAQLLGAVAAGGLIWLVLSANAQLTNISRFFSVASNGFGERSAVQFPLASAFLLEVVATALLVAVFLGAGAARARRDLAPFAVGLAYVGLLSFLLPVTNGGINPARSLASAVFAEPWALGQLWLFWAAPVVGALIGGLVYRSVDTWSPGRRAAGPAPAFEPEDEVRSGRGEVTEPTADDEVRSGHGKVTEPTADDEVRSAHQAIPGDDDVPGGRDGSVSATTDRPEPILHGDTRSRHRSGAGDAASFFDTEAGDATDSTNATGTDARDATYGSDGSGRSHGASDDRS